jgi:hypothetical protein
MSNLETCAYDSLMERSLFLLELATPDELPRHIDVGSKYFGTLIAWDARGVPAEEVASLAEALMESGCTYFVCWGPDCERVHDIVDECRESNASRIGILTTWHADETLDDAVWVFLNTTVPDPLFENQFHSSVAITIGSPSWASVVRTAFLDPRAFSARVLATSDV